MVISEEWDKVGGERSVTKLGSAYGRPSGNYTCNIDLTSLNVEGGLFKDFFPVITLISYGAYACGNVGVGYSYSFNEQTKVLTITFSSTGYIFMSTSGYVYVDIYQIK